MVIDKDDCLLVFIYMISVVCFSRFCFLLVAHFVISVQGMLAIPRYINLSANCSKRFTKKGPGVRSINNRS